MTTTENSSPKPRRRTKGEQGYDLIRQASRQTELVPETMLRAIALEINPAATVSRLYIFEHLQMEDLPPQMNTLSSGWLGFLGHVRMAETLAFFRAQGAQWHSGQTRWEAHLVLEIERAPGDGRSMWIDCETGLPWRPAACERVASALPKDEQDATRELYARATEAARRVMAQCGQAVKEAA